MRCAVTNVDYVVHFGSVPAPTTTDVADRHRTDSDYERDHDSGLLKVAFANSNADSGEMLLAVSDDSTNRIRFVPLLTRSHKFLK